MRVFASVVDIRGSLGADLGSTEWRSIDQPVIDAFADLTGDHSWIHVDAARASATSYGGTIAHGFFTLALIADASSRLFHLDGTVMTINYGLDRVRFPAAVPSGAKVRTSATVVAVDELDGGCRLKVRYTVTSDRGSRPVCVADHLSVRYLADRDPVPGVASPQPHR